MATNQFFQNYEFFNEQQLIDDLVIESIQIYGVDTFYLNRTTDNFDNIINEDSVSIFNRAHQMEMYIKSVDGFEGEGDFLSKFGLQIRDQVTFSVAIRTFEKFVTRLNTEITVPREGDLVYMPMNDKFFKIMHLEHESVFYQTGALQVYDLKCELFEYSNERFETGIENIDLHYEQYNTTEITDLETLKNNDVIAKNFFYEEEGDNLIDFSETDPFSEIISFPTDRSENT